jgi:hypothetical protein
LLRKPERKAQFERPRIRWESSVEMYWIQQAEDRVQWQAVIYKIIILLVLYMGVDLGISSKGENRS